MTKKQAKGKRPVRLRYIQRADGEWRWQKKNMGNGEIIGASSERFKRVATAEKNYDLMTMPPDEISIERKDGTVTVIKQIN